MKRVQLLSLTLVAVIFSAFSQSIKNKEIFKIDLFGTHHGKEVYLLTLTNKAGNGDILIHSLKTTNNGL